MTKTPCATIGMTVTRIAGTAAVALAMLLSISAASQPAAARVVAALPAAELAAAKGAATSVAFKGYSGHRGHSFKGRHHFGGFGFKKPGFQHRFHGSRFGSVGIKKFGHSGVAIKKHGSPIRGFHGKAFRPHGLYGHRGFKRY